MFCPRCEMYTDKPCEQCNYPYDFDPIYDCEFRADVAHALLEKEKLKLWKRERKRKGG